MTPQKPQSIQSLLEAYDCKTCHQVAPTGKKIPFKGVEPLDVYNITAPIEEEGKSFILGRVEERSSEISTISLFEKKEGYYEISKVHPSFQGLQDPCITRIAEEWIVGGVEWPIANPKDPSDPIFRMKFYKGKTLRSLEFFYEGPDNMKDIRFLDLHENGVALFTRPHQGSGPDGRPIPRGLIGFTVLSSLRELSNDQVLQAPLYRNQFVAPLEWGGANEAHLLKNGKIGILGHVAQDEIRAEKMIKHYYSMTFSIDLRTLEASALKIIARRSNFPSGPMKRDYLEDVIFSGGIHRLSSGRALLYTGLSDVEAGVIEIEDPFTEYE